jgi:hypothetical protein
MLLKSADDKSKRLALLEDLKKSPYLDSQQKKWLSEELHRCKKGIQGERESAHYLDSYFKNRENHVLLHDLRFVLDDDVAQIDHLVLNRAGHFFLIETKNYSGDLMINERGEFTVQYDQDAFGIPSPWEQSRRHERILAKILERLDISGRLDKLPDFHHVVMMHPKAIINRPDQAVFDTSFLIKADQFPTWHGNFVEKVGTGTLIKSLFNMRSPETIAEWGEKLKRQHRPSDLFALPDFMKPKAKNTEPTAKPVPAPALVASNAPPTATEDVPAKKLICAHCGSKITYPEGKFCWNNSNRFGGLQYCREHQSLFTAA